MVDNRYGKKMQLAYERFLSSVKEYRMEEKLCRGVLVGFSGGPDSVLLLHLLKRYSEEQRPFKIVAAHVHHGIRGEEADRDAAFAEKVCKSLGVAFIIKKADVPAIALENKIGIEEAARNVRYSFFEEIIVGRNDIETIALGHNATDNLETVIFHLMRGCGTGGLAGIPPVRERVIRPLIALSKTEILAALEEAHIPFVFDKSNSDTAYTRNYIRHEILPRLSHISSSPEVSARRVCRNLICDNDYIESSAESAFHIIENGKACARSLFKLHPAVLSRVLFRWGKENGCTLEQTHLQKLCDLIGSKRHFSYDLPSNMLFTCKDGICRFISRNELCAEEKNFLINVYPEEFRDLSIGSFLITKNGIDNISSNIYNFSIKANLRSAIIKGDLFLRNRREGDCYYYGGMTHKLKKLFNDKKIPLQKRESIPILCDEKGIVWVPGFGVRDDGGCDENALTAAFFY
jgi:tRNA(Ile)-lysidine synthase